MLEVRRGVVVRRRARTESASAKNKSRCLRVRHHFHHVRIGDLLGALDALLQRAHRSIVPIEQTEHGGIDGGGIDHRLVALNIDDQVRVRCRGDFGHAVGSGGMIGAGHHHARPKLPGRVANAFVIGGDDHAGQIARLRRPFPHVLEHGFAGNRDESFAGKSGGSVPGGDYAKNPVRHNRL